MFAILLLPGNRAVHLDLDEHFDLETRDPEAHLRWVLSSYDARRDEQWVVAPPVGAAIVMKLLAEGRGDPSRELPAIRALGWYGLPEHVAAILPYADHADEGLRRAAIHALGQLAHFDTIPLLQAHLASDPSRPIQLESLGALGKMGKMELLPEIDAAAQRGTDFAAVAGEARVRTVATAAEGLERLARHLLHSSDYEDLCIFMTFVQKVPLAVLANPAELPLPRLRAARLLGLTRQRKSFRPIGSIMANAAEPIELRIECAVALGRLEHPKAVELLVTVLEDPNTPPDLEVAVVHSLGRTGSSRAIAPLLRHWDARGGTLRDRVRLATRDAARTEGAQDVLDRFLWIDSANAVGAVAEVVLVERDHYVTRIDDVGSFVAKLDDAGARIRRDALLLLAYVGTTLQLPRLERAVIEDPSEDNRWLAAIVHRRISTR